MNFKNKNLLDQFEIDAMWSIDTLDDEGVFGTLHYSQDKIILEIPNSDMKISTKFNIIYGKNQTRVINLYNVRVIKRYSNQLRNTRLIAEYMIIDTKKIDQLEDFKVQTINFSFDYLPLFFNDNIWDTKNDIIFEKIIDIQSYRIKNLKATLFVNYKAFKNSGLDAREGLIITLKTVPYLKIKYQQTKNIMDVKKDIFKIKNLLMLFSGAPLMVSGFNFNSGSIDILGNKMPIKGQLYFTQAKSERKQNQLFSVYNYRDIMNKFDQYTNNFLNKYNKLRPIIQNLTINMSRKNLVETQFYDSITSLEVYHREFIEDESSLTARVKKLFRKLPIELKEHLIFKEQNFTSDKVISNFSYQCSQTRNYHAHGNIERNKDIFIAKELIPVSKILNLVSEYYLMKEIGLEEKIIIYSIKNKKLYQTVLQSQYDFKEII